MSQDAPPRLPRDPGRQPERTRLSWRRTVLAATVVALLTGRMAVELPAAAAVFAVVAAVAGWWGMLLLAGRRITSLATAVPAPVRRAVPLTVLVTLAYAVVGVALVTMA